MDRLLHRIVKAVIPNAYSATLWIITFFSASLAANAQFKVVGPAPYPPTVARQKIKTLLEGIDPANPKQTVDTLSGLLSWYRDIVDDELIAAWRKDARANLTEVMGPLADSRVASAVVEFSWRERREAAFNPTFAPMFENLMTRFPESAQPFLDDLLGPIASGQPTPNLSQPEAETVCRILIDMPDIGTWRKSTQQILPHYRRVAESLLVQDAHGSDQEKSYQAQRWLADLKIDLPGITTEQPSPRRRTAPDRSAVAVNDSTPTGDQIASVPPLPRTAEDRPLTPAVATMPPAHPPLPTSPMPSAPIPSAPPPYSGARSGTLESTGGPIPQNAEYVFRNVPLVKMQLDYDTKVWDARLAPGDGQSQRLIVRNKGSGPRKRCVVHWSIVP
jgi:hypothetical protein